MDQHVELREHCTKILHINIIRSFFFPQQFPLELLAINAIVLTSDNIYYVNLNTDGYREVLGLMVQFPNHKESIKKSYLDIW